MTLSRTRHRILALGCLLAILSASAVPAAEYDVYGPKLELRRVQFCIQCDTGLVVTTMPPGAKIQCPTCSTVQLRLETEKLLSHLFQVCPHCGSRMEMSQFEAGQRVACGTCGHKQRVLPEATYRFDRNMGNGRAPKTTTVPASLGPAHEEETHPPAGDAALSPKELDPEDLSPELTPPGVFDETPTEDAKPDATQQTPPPLPAAPSETPPPPTRIEPDVSPPPAMPDPEEASRRPNGAQRAAIVNGHVIERADVQRELSLALDGVRARLGKRAYTPEGKALLMRQAQVLQTHVLDRLIDRALVAQAAEAEGLAPVTRDVLAEAHRMRASGTGWEDASALMEAARADLILREAMRRHAVARHEIPPADIRAFYEENAAAFRQPHQVRLRGLIIYRNRQGRSDARSAREIATEVVAQIAAGVPFERLVAQYGEDPLHGQGGQFPPGGSLVRAEMLAGPVRDLLTDARPGKPLGPVLLAGSVAFITLEEERPAHIPPLAEVSRHIHERLRQQAAEAAFDQWLASLRDRAAITRF